MVNEEGEMIEYFSDEDLMNDFDKKEAVERIVEEIRNLDPKSRYVMGCIYYGMTLEEIGCQLGVTVSRVSQLKKRAEKLIKNKLEVSYDLD